MYVFTIYEFWDESFSKSHLFVVSRSSFQQCCYIDLEQFSVFIWYVIITKIAWTNWSFQLDQYRIHGKKKRNCFWNCLRNLFLNIFNKTTSLRLQTYIVSYIFSNDSYCQASLFSKLVRESHKHMIACWLSDLLITYRYSSHWWTEST